MSRKFANISINDLEAKIKAIVGDEGDSFIVQKLEKDIKVEFDTENYETTKGYAGPQSLMGYNQEENGFTYLGVCSGGDWETPIFFCVYWDGKRIRGYVPTEGNPWNTDTKTAYGNDDISDNKNIKKRYPDKFVNNKENDIEYLDLDFDEIKIKKDILERIKHI